MSKRSKWKHREQLREQRERLKQASEGPGEPHGKPGHRRPFKEADGKFAVIVMAASVAIIGGFVLYAMSGSSGRKTVTGTVAATEQVSSSGNASPDTVLPAPAPLLSATNSAAESAAALGPKIQFATPVYDFGRINRGESSKYDFIFTNLGDQTLELTAVHPSCGCTTAGEWSRQVEPGHTGSIPIQFNSGSFSGLIAKTVTVSCNDTSQPVVTLQIKATVWTPIDVVPQYAIFNLTAETPSNSMTLRIVNNTEETLELSELTCNHSLFAVELQTNQPGKEYQLLVQTVPPLPDSGVQGQITMKTSLAQVPVLNINAWAHIQPVVTAMPAQIALPMAPLEHDLPHTIAIRNSGTNNLVLSEPAVNAKGVDIDIQELQPGAYFNVTMNFPQGFEIAQGETVELSIKSNHPQFPVIKVPVIQPPRPAPVAPAPPAAPPAQ